MRTFKINDKYEITCKSEKTRYGFRHLAELHRTGHSGTAVLIDVAKICYYNRTWESYEFESVLKKLADNSKNLSKEEKRDFDKFLGRNVRVEKERVNAEFKQVGMVMALGEMFGQTQKEKNDWKERMLKAGFEGKGLYMPEDWDTISEDDKEARLNLITKFMQKEVV